MNAKGKFLMVAGLVCFGACVFAGPPRHHHYHNEGLELANGIVDLVCRVLRPAPVVVTPAPAVVTPAPVVVTPPPAVVTPAPVVVAPAPVVVAPARPVVIAPPPRRPVHYRPAPPPRRPAPHHGGRGRR